MIAFQTPTTIISLLPYNYSNDHLSICEGPLPILKAYACHIKYTQYTYHKM